MQEQGFCRQIQLSKDSWICLLLSIRDARWKIPMRLSRVRALVLVVVTCIFSGTLEWAEKSMDLVV